MVGVPEEIGLGLGVELETFPLSPADEDAPFVDGVSPDGVSVGCGESDDGVSVDGVSADGVSADGVSADGVSAGDGSVGGGESDEVEKNWYPEDGVVDCGVLAAAAGAGAGVDDIAVAGNVASEPTSSSTTGAFANGSGVLEGCAGADATCECLSLMTGTLCAVWTTCFVEAAAAAGAGVRLTVGSGARACSFGTRSSGA